MVRRWMVVSVLSSEMAVVQLAILFKYQILGVFKCDDDVDDTDVDHSPFPNRRIVSHHIIVSILLL
jgi:hypothetical protein